MKRSPVEPLSEIIRQALVLVRGTLRIEVLYKQRPKILAEEFSAELARAINETASEYGPTFDDDCAVEQMFDNAELPS